MGSVRDATGRFRDAVHSAAIKEGYDEEKVAKITSSLIMHKSVPRSSFTCSAIEILGNIRTMHAFILRHGKDYSDRYRSTEKERDSIEHEVGLFVKACRESIDVLKDSIGAEEKKSGRSGWLIGGKNALNKDLNAHQHGMVLILSEHLHAVTAQFDQLRSGRFQEAIDKRLLKKRRGLESLNPISTTSYELNGSTISTFDGQGFQNDGQSEASQSQQMLDEETHALQVELTNLMDTVQETERKVIEVSALNHLFSTHVLHQAQQIEKLYQQALDVTQNVDRGNKELFKANQRNSSNRLYICLVLIVLTLALLFLDWYE